MWVVLFLPAVFGQSFVGPASSGVGSAFPIYGQPSYGPSSTYGAAPIYGASTSVGATAYGTPIYGSAPVYGTPLSAPAAAATPIYGAAPVYSAPISTGLTYGSPYDASPIYAPAPYGGPVYGQTIYGSTLGPQPMSAGASTSSPAKKKVAIRPQGGLLGSVSSTWNTARRNADYDYDTDGRGDEPQYSFLAARLAYLNNGCQYAPRWCGESASLAGFYQFASNPTLFLAMASGAMFGGLLP